MPWLNKGFNIYSAMMFQALDHNKDSLWNDLAEMTFIIPAIEMVEIGAGGGSIARIDNMNRITVGPESAGANPGPASYGQGGSDATVTDADVVLGRIDPEGFADGARCSSKRDDLEIWIIFCVYRTTLVNERLRHDRIHFQLTQL